MKRITLFVAALIFVQIAVFGETPGRIIFIDSRLLLVSHPLVKTFNPQNRRFTGSSSDPEFVQKYGEDALLKLISETHTSLNLLEKSWKVRFSSASGIDRLKLEKEFLAEKKDLEAKLENLRGQRFNVKTLPGKSAFSLSYSIIPQTNKIEEDIRMAVLSLKEKMKAEIVLDVSSLTPSSIPPFNGKVLIEPNIQEVFRVKEKTKKGENRKQADLSKWISEARNYWLKAECFDPILYGARDCRMEAVEELARRLEKKK